MKQPGHGHRATERAKGELCAQCELELGETRKLSPELEHLAHRRGRRRRPDRPGLKPAQMCNPRSYVTHRDLRSWAPGIVQAHGGELGQWRRCDELSKTALAIAAVLSIFSGLRRGEAGAGVQMDARRWGRLIGVSDRAVRAAFAQLEAAGWVKRRRSLIAHEWTETYNSRRVAKPVERRRNRADVHGRAYLLPLGQVRVLRRGERQGELVQKLRKTHAGEIRTIAKRISDALESFLPSLFKGERRDERNDGAAARRPRSLPPPATGPPSRSSAAAPHQAATAALGGAGAVDHELERLWGLGALTPAMAYPDHWFKGTDENRRWVRREFERYRPELVRRFVLSATPAQVEQLQRRLEADAERVLRVFEEQPSQRARAIAKYEAKVAAFRRGIERLGKGH